MWQGFELRLTGNFGVPPTTNTPIEFPLPVRDTAGFFDAGEPDRITIPQGVTVMDFTAGMRRSTISAQFNQIAVARIGPEGVPLAATARGYAGGTMCSTGPVQVVAGEQYAAWAYFTTASTIIAERTWFSGTVLEAEPV
jgi:hypothetical protein